MKKHILIRVLSAVGGVVLWLMCLSILAETFFHVPLMEKIGQLLNAGTPVSVLIALLAAIALGAFGTCCLLMLSGKRAVKSKGFVMQKGENGMIGVSVKSIEGLVQTCVKQHDMIASADVAVVERRDGIVILLSIEETAGVNIPLAVGALQKQIKQYVNTCTGLDVREVRVMVENTEESVVASPYAVENPAAAIPAVPEQSAEPAEPVHEAPAVQAAPAAEAPAEDIPAAEAVPMAENPAAVQESAAVPTVNIPVVPLGPMIPVMPEMPQEEDDRPLHQRLFGAEEQPVFVPAPPELMMEPAAEETAAEVPAAAEEEALEAAPAADELDADAVLEVVQAIGAEAAEETASGEPSESADEAREGSSY